MKQLSNCELSEGHGPKIPQSYVVLVINMSKEAHECLK